MRIISIRDDIEQIVLQYVLASPDIYLDYDISRVQLVPHDTDDVCYAADVVFVESDEIEIVLGDVSLGTDLILEFDVYSE